MLRKRIGGMRIFNQLVPSGQTESRKAIGEGKPPSGSRLTLAADASQIHGRAT